MNELRGYVAFIDVLGFKQLMARERPLEELSRYVQTIIDATDVPGQEELQYVLFSDSIVINTRSAGYHELVRLLSTCSRLFASLIERRIPVRGAIASGPFVRYANADRGVIVAGQPIIDAITFERQQDWVGVTLTPGLVEEIAVAPSLVENIKDLDARISVMKELGMVHTHGDVSARLPWPMMVGRCEHIPFRSEEGSGHLAGYSLLPTRGSPAQVANDLEVAVRSLDRMRSYAPDPRSQAKYAATTEWLKSIALPWRSKLSGAAWEHHLKESGRG